MLKPIKNNKQHEDSLARIYELMQKNIKANSAESDELEVLSITVKQLSNMNRNIIRFLNLIL